MALLIDASSPAVVTGNPTTTTAPFTPPDDSLLLVGWSGNAMQAIDPPQPSIADSLGAGHLTYTLVEFGSRADSVDQVDGQVAFWTAPIAFGGTMTVTVTNNDSTARDAALKVWVLTGATVGGAHGKGLSISSAAVAQSYTAVANNGQGFLVTCDWDAKGTETAGTGCTLDVSGTIPSQISYGFEHRTTADGTAGGSTTMNMTLPGTSTNFHWSWVEVVPLVGDPPEKDPPPFISWHPPGDGISPNGIWNPWLGTDTAAPTDTGLRIHESSPSIAVNTAGTATACTTLSFTPPAGSLLLVLWAGNSLSPNNPTAPTITDSLGTPLTYTLSDWQSRADTPTVNGQAAAWTAPVVASAPMTVTVNNNAASPVRHAAVQVLVLVNQAAAPVGAHGKAGSASAAQIVQSYTAQANLGQGFLVVSDWDATGLATPGIDCFTANARADNVGTFPTQMSYGMFKRTVPDDVNTVANRLASQLAGTSANLSWAYIEIKPGAAGGGTCTAADTAAATDVATASVVVARSAADTAQAVDTAARALAGQRTTADASAATDAAGRATLALARAAAETAAAADAGARVLAQARAAADAAVATDTATRAAQALARTATDASTATDVAARAAFQRSRVTSETAAASDAAAGQLGIARTASDTAAAADTAVRGSESFLRTAADTAAATDAAARASSRARTGADAASAADAAVRGLADARTSADAAAATDVAARAALAQARSTADAAAATDAAVGLSGGGLARSATDTAQAADAAARAALVFARTTPDTAAATDIATRLGARARTAAEAALAADTAVKAFIRLPARTTTSAAFVVDGAARAVQVFTRAGVDQAAAADSAVGVPNLVVTGVALYSVDGSAAATGSVERSGGVTFGVDQRTDVGGADATAGASAGVDGPTAGSGLAG